jgi:predicted DNA binding CopG/RHH family protein
MVRTGKISSRGFLNKEDVKNMFLEFQQKTKDIERKLTLFDNIKTTYAQLVAQKSTNKMPHKNAILNVVVST